jgi:hypothetical protein
VVARVLNAADEQTLLAALASPQFDPAREAISTGSHGREPAPKGPTELGRGQPDRLALDARPRPGIPGGHRYVLPGWTARGRGAVPIHRVDHLLRGVVLPPGRHRVTMTYEPEGWRPSVLITRGGVGAVDRSPWPPPRGRSGHGVA